MPNLIKLYQDNADLREHFEIIAFHDNSVKSIAEAYEKINAVPAIKEKWGISELPFPVLLDETPSTIEGWGIRAFPTTVLIDPEGKLVKGRAEGLLDEQLRRLRDERSSKK